MAWLLVDVAWILVFALLGRESHGGDAGPLAVLGVAWPFLAGYAVSALLLELRRRPRAIGRGAIVWIGTLLIGMAIRTVLEGRLPDPAFIIVAAVVLGAGLVGWRAIALLACRRRRAATDESTD